MKPAAYFLCALALALIAISPFLILSFYEKPAEPEQYSGILTLWHISGWRTGGSSAAAFLEKRIVRYEAQNPRVFIELECLSGDEAAAAFADGLKPDIISYPYGFDVKPDLAQLPPAASLPFSPRTAYPYLYGGYCIIINTDMLGERGVDVYEGWGIRPERLLEAAKLGVCFDSEDGCTSLPALAAHAYPPAGRPSISAFGEPEPPDAALSMAGAWEDGLDIFLRGEAAVLIASHRQLFEVQQKYERGEAPGFKAYAAGGYTDMIQMISVCADENEQKQEAAKRFASLLLENGAQRGLDALGVFPAVAGVDIYNDDETRKAMYTLLSENAMLGEPRDIESLISLATQAFSGNEKALKLLRIRLSSPAKG